MATQTEGKVAATLLALADAKARLDTATQAGIDTSRIKRHIAQLEFDLATAQRRAMEEFHAVPTNPAA